MMLSKKIKTFISHPIASLKKIWQYVVYKPRFRRYFWTDRVCGVNQITCKHVSLDKNVYIGPRCRIQGIEQYMDDRFSPQIIIHDNVSIQQDFYLTCASTIEIGADTAIAAFVTITDIDHPYLDVGLPIEKQNIRVKNVAIGEGCKIYNGAVITYGCKIGNHCVVGANSVVKGCYPDFCVIVGNPSRIVKRYNDISGQWQKTDDEGRFLD